MRRCVSWLSVLLLVLAAGRAGAEFPPPPGPTEFLWDQAGLVSEDDAKAIRRLQATVWEDHERPVVVATIPSMAHYQGNMSIEAFAREWYDAWGLGSEEHNAGILLLVGVADRKARIELGADWGKRWDRHARRVMDDVIVPAFKRSEFSQGLREGMVALCEMAAAGPEAEPPTLSFTDQVAEYELIDGHKDYQPMPIWLANLCLVIGAALMVSALFVPGYRTFLIVIGGLLVITGLSVWLMVILMAGAVRTSASGSSWGGGFSGGYSGGGGATGSW